MPKLTLEDLKRKRAALDVKIRSVQARTRSQNRKMDTRRKVLAGAAVLNHAENDAQFKAQLDKLLGGFLTRKEERQLFELP